MENRGIEKKDTGITGRYMYGSAVCSGLVSMCSDEKVQIYSEKCFPIFSRFDIYFNYNETLLLVTVQVNELLEGGNGHSTMIVDVLYPLENFQKLVSSIVLTGLA